MLKISFDIGGVISKYPQVFIPMMRALTAGGAEVHVITDMHDREKVLDQLESNGVVGGQRDLVWDDLTGDWIKAPVLRAHVHTADYDTHGERCKAVLIAKLGIDLHIDDFPGYCAGGGLQLMVWPNPDEPYWHDNWKTDPKDGSFGRRKFTYPVMTAEEVEKARKDAGGDPKDGLG